MFKPVFNPVSLYSLKSKETFAYLSKNLYYSIAFLIFSIGEFLIVLLCWKNLKSSGNKKLGRFWE